tara:strand:- start:1226 stop:1660 length:435 start_codon:yes stop_codon:yes gene_type:complete
MTRLQKIDLGKFAPHSVGFDRLFDDVFRHTENSINTGYPPYNIINMDQQFQIELAIAGVRMEDVDIQLAENVLTISHDPQDIDAGEWKWIHRGIARRKFTRSFTLTEDVVVNGARMENGMLYIELERIIPEEKKPRTIEIKQIS